MDAVARHPAGLNFAGVTYYDGQGFMVPKKLNVKSAKELDGATVCVQPGTTTELNLADYFRANNMKFKPVVIENLQEVNAAFFAGRCDVLTTDASGLASIRRERLQGQPGRLRDPAGDHLQGAAGAGRRQGDDQWFDIVRWTVNALIEAEEYGITQANVEEMAKTTTNPIVARMLGQDARHGQGARCDGGLGRQGGSRRSATTARSGSATLRRSAFTRGLNKSVEQGRLMYAPPIR